MTLTRTRTVVLSLLAAGLLFAGTALSQTSQQPDETLPGFKANLAYSASGIDNVSLYSGDPGVVIPLGPEYPLSAGTTWQLKAYYSAKFWDIGSGLCVDAGNGTRESGMVTYLHGRPNLGVGWTLEVGYVKADFDNGYGAWVSPDGGRHQFIPELESSWGVTTDGTNLRLRSCGQDCQEIDFPDGSIQKFSHRYSPERTNTAYPDFYFTRLDNDLKGVPQDTALGLTEMRDRFGTLVLQVGYSAPGQFTSITLNPGTSQPRVVSLTWGSYTVTLPTDLTITTWPVVTGMVFPTASGPLVATPQRQAGIFRRLGTGGLHCATPTLVAAPLLSGLDLTGGSSGISYGFGTVLPADLVQDAMRDGEGALASVTLPTGGRIEYEYNATAARCSPCGAQGNTLPGGDPTSGPIGSEPPWMQLFQQYVDRSWGVYKRREIDRNGATVLSTTNFERHNVRRPVNGELHLIRRALRSVEGGSSQVSFFGVDHLSPAFELQREYYEGQGALGPRVRVEVSCYEGENSFFETRSPICGISDPLLGEYDQPNFIRRTKSITWYGDLPRDSNGYPVVSGGDCDQAYSRPAGQDPSRLFDVPCQQTAWADYNRYARQFGTETLTVTPRLDFDGTARIGVSNILVAGHWNSLTTTTDWLRTASSDPWILGRFSLRNVTEAYSNGCPTTNAPCSVTTTNTYSQQKPAFLASVTVSGSGSGTLTRSFPASDASGNPTQEVEQAGGTGLSGGSYTTLRTFQSGLVTSRRASGLAVEWNAFDVTRDSATGAVTASRDPNGFATLYSWDALGRLTSITPPDSEAGTLLCYTPSSDFGPYAVVRRTATPPGSCGSLADSPALDSMPFAAYQYDGLGRLRREVRLLPNENASSFLALRETRYDAAGRRSFLSEWQSCGTTHDSLDAKSCFVSSVGSGPATVWSGFDAFDRPRRIDRPDGTWSTISYADFGMSDSPGTQSTTDCLSGCTGAGGVTATRTTRKDILGRMLAAADPPDSTTGLVLFYDTNVLGKIVRVRDGGDGVPYPTLDPSYVPPASRQIRTFTFDHLGFLREESHPERIADENNNSLDVVTRYPYYDARGNVVQKIEKRRFGPDLAQYDSQYDEAGRLTFLSIGGTTYLSNIWDGQSGTGGSNPKGRLTRRVGYNPASTPAEAVTDTFDYAGRGGRLSSRTTLFGNGFSSVQGWTYNALGLVEEHQHPRTTGTYRSTTRLKAGLPYSLATDSQPLVSEATYGPSGSLASYTSGNGVVTTIVPDPWGMARPAEIRATLGATTLFSTGTYAYDGTGNVTATGSDSFQYDPAGRLWQSSVSSLSGTKTDVYTYDAFGNMATHTVDGSDLTLSPSVRTNRLTGTGTTYDVFGNLTARPSETFAYDPLSRMTRYSGSGGTEEYLYDGAGERVVRFGQVTTAMGIAVPSGSTLPGATPGVSYSFTFQASGGTGPYAWSLVSGSLPSGLNFSPSGVLAGTPATSGSYSFTVKVRDSGQAVQEATRALTLVVSGTQGLSYYTVAPCRVLDTRDAGRGGPIVGGAEPRTFLAAGACGIPSTARSLVSNVTLVNPPSLATVGLFPAGQATPTPLNVSGLARAGTVRAVFSMIRIDGPTPGSFSAVTDLPAGQSVHVIVDVSGYFAVAQGQGIARGGGMEPAAVGGVRFYTLRDEEHRLSTEYQQDASIGTRVAKDYFYFGNRLVATNTAWGAAQGWHFYTTDHLGTPRLKTDIAGTVVARPKYRPFGERIGETPEQGPELAGMERDTVSGDYYVHARYQRSSLGRFNSLDSVLGTPEAPASWNRFAYAKNSPIKFVDLNGRWPTTVKEVHQASIDRVLGFLPAHDRQTLKAQQVVADQDQRAAYQFMHAMRAAGSDLTEARGKADAYVKKTLTRAMELEGAGRHDSALLLLGLAIHTLQDATSPTHEGFQEWSDGWDARDKQVMIHMTDEFGDPGSGSHLDAATMKAWKIFAGRESMPASFFSTSGNYDCPFNDSVCNAKREYERRVSQ